MPFRRSYRKRTSYRGKRRVLNARKSRPKNYRRYRKGGPTIGRSRSVIVPDEQFMKLKYNGVATMLISAGSISNYIWSGNSVYDPDVSGTGHQPMGFDQWSAFYNKYTCFGSKITVEILNISGATAGAQNIQATLMPLASRVATSVPQSVTDINVLYEYPYCQHKEGNIVGGASRLKFKSYMSTAKIDGVSKQKIAIDDNYTALISADPVNEWKWMIAAQTADQSSGVTLKAIVTITYYVKMFDRIPLTQS